MNLITTALYNNESFHPIIYDEREGILDEQTASDKLLSNWCWGYLEGVKFSELVKNLIWK